MVRKVGSKLFTKLLLLISSITFISLLALTRCGLGVVVNENNSLIGEDGKLPVSHSLFKHNIH